MFVPKLLNLEKCLSFDIGSILYYYTRRILIWMNKGEYKIVYKEKYTYIVCVYKVKKVYHFTIKRKIFASQSEAQV